MKGRLILEIALEQVRAVLVLASGEEVRASESRVEHASLPAAIAATLKSLMDAPLRRVPAVVVVNEREMPVREVDGLPLTTKRALLERGMSRSAARFFPRAKRAMAVRLQLLPEEGRGVAVAIEPEVLEDIGAALKARKIERGVLLPTCVSLWAALGEPDEVRTFSTGCESIALVRGGALYSYRTRRVQGPEAPPSLSEDGEGDWMVVRGALRAADSALGRHLSIPIHSRDAARHWRLAGVVAGMMVAFIFFAPVVAARVQLAARGRMTAQARDSLAGYQRETVEFRRMSDRLAAVAHDGGRSAEDVLGELAALTRALPPHLP